MSSGIVVIFAMEGNQRLGADPDLGHIEDGFDGG